MMYENPCQNDSMLFLLPSNNTKFHSKLARPLQKKHPHPIHLYNSILFFQHIGRGYAEQNITFSRSLHLF